MFQDVNEARILRGLMMQDPEAYRYPVTTNCPICHRTTLNHNGTWTTPKGWTLHLPCWSRNEYDRYGLHVRPTNGGQEPIWNGR